MLNEIDNKIKPTVKFRFPMEITVVAGKAKVFSIAAILGLGWWTSQSSLCGYDSA